MYFYRVGNNTSHHKPILNLSVHDFGQFLISPLETNFDPQGKSWPPGVNFVLELHIGVKLSTRGEEPLFAPSFFLRVEFVHPWG
jgi:hypothetical protein